MRLSSLGHPAFPSWAEKAARERRAALIPITAVHTLGLLRDRLLPRLPHLFRVDEAVGSPSRDRL